MREDEECTHPNTQTESETFLGSDGIWYVAWHTFCTDCYETLAEGVTEA